MWKYSGFKGTHSRSGTWELAPHTSNTSPEADADQQETVKRKGCAGGEGTTPILLPSPPALPRAAVRPSCRCLHPSLVVPKSSSRWEGSCRGGWKQWHQWQTQGYVGYSIPCSETCRLWHYKEKSLKTLKSDQELSKVPFTSVFSFVSAFHGKHIIQLKAWSDSLHHTANITLAKKLFPRTCLVYIKLSLFNYGQTRRAFIPYPEKQNFLS